MIKVNEVEIPESRIFSEMQYYPSKTQEEAQFKATEALIIEEVLRQRAIALSLIDEDAKLEEDVSEKLLDTEIVVPKAASEACRSYYNNNLQRFKSFPFLAIKHILLKADPQDLEARESSKVQAEHIIKQLEHSPEMFTALAQNYSSCPSSEVGGELGQIDKGQTVPEFETQIIRYAEGLIPEPIETRYGYHVVFIEKLIEGKLLDFEQVESKINDYLNEKVKRKATAQYIARMLQEADIDGIEFNIGDDLVMQ